MVSGLWSPSAGIYQQFKTKPSLRAYHNEIRRTCRFTKEAHSLEHIKTTSVCGVTPRNAVQIAELAEKCGQPILFSLNSSDGRIVSLTSVIGILSCGVKAGDTICLSAEENIDDLILQRILDLL